MGSRMVKDSPRPILFPRLVNSRAFANRSRGCFIPPIPALPGDRRAARPRRTRTRGVRTAYRLQRALRPNAGWRWLSARIEASGPARARGFTAAERVVKEDLFGCRMCGQCALPVTGYVCPMGCPKELRNGPCGGQVGPDGSCEVYPALMCVSGSTPTSAPPARAGPPTCACCTAPPTTAAGASSTWSTMAGPRRGAVDQPGQRARRLPGQRTGPACASAWRLGGFALVIVEISLVRSEPA